MGNKKNRRNKNNSKKNGEKERGAAFRDIVDYGIHNSEIFDDNKSEIVNEIKSEIKEEIDYGMHDSEILNELNSEIKEEEIDIIVYTDIVKDEYEEDKSLKFGAKCLNKDDKNHRILNSEQKDSILLELSNRVEKNSPSSEICEDNIIQSTGIPQQFNQFGQKMPDKLQKPYNINLHTRVKSYKCCFCESSFTVEKDFREHLMVHSYKCEVCHKTFAQRTNFAHHMNSAHKYFKQNKDQQSRISEASSLNPMLETHQDLERKFKCHICSKDYSSTSSLICHMGMEHIGKSQFVLPKASKANPETESITTETTETNEQSSIQMQNSLIDTGQCEPSSLLILQQESNTYPIMAQSVGSNSYTQGQLVLPQGTNTQRVTQISQVQSYMHQGMNTNPALPLPQGQILLQAMPQLPQGTLITQGLNTQSMSQPQGQLLLQSMPQMMSQGMPMSQGITQPISLGQLYPQGINTQPILQVSQQQHVFPQSLNGQSITQVLPQGLVFSQVVNGQSTIHVPQG